MWAIRVNKAPLNFYKINCKQRGENIDVIFRTSIKVEVPDYFDEIKVLPDRIKNIFSLITKLFCQKN